MADKVIAILSWAIIIRALLSFFPQIRYNKIVQILNDVTDPLLKPFRRFQIGGQGFSVDFSPILAIFVLGMISTILHSLL